jgi:hypothetical protein
LSIRSGISKLLRILGAWESAQQRDEALTTGDRLPNGLTLELNAYSPSDSEHWFKNYHFQSEVDDGNNDNDDKCKPHNPAHGWIDGQRVLPPPATAIQRLFPNHPILFDFLQFEDYTPVGSITRLVIPRGLRRSFHSVSLLELLRNMSAVEHLVFEPWRQWDVESRERYDSGKWAHF